MNQQPFGWFDARLQTAGPCEVRVLHTNSPLEPDLDIAAEPGDMLDVSFTRCRCTRCREERVRLGVPDPAARRVRQPWDVVAA